MQIAWIDFHQISSGWHILLEVLSAQWLQNLILALTAVIGIWTLRTTSRQERRRATFDAVHETLDSPAFQEARTKVLELLKAGLDIPYLLSEAGLVNRKIVLRVLSRYEFMAAGVNEGDFDAKIYQRMYYTNVIADWNNLEAFVLELRESRNTDTPFQELQKLVQKWKKHPLKAYKSLKPRMKISQSRKVSSQISAQSNQGESSTPGPLVPLPAVRETIGQEADAGKLMGAVHSQIPPEKQ